MKSKRVLIVVFTIVVPLLLVFGLASCAGSDLRADFSHQGRLLTSSGAVVPDGNYTIRYRLFHSFLPGATPVYTETKTVAVKGGLFDTSIGLTSVITPEIFSRSTWMEVAVNGEVLSPLQPLEGAPFASSLVPGAVIQGGVPITSTVGGLSGLGSALYVWNQNSAANGGNGLTVINEASGTAGGQEQVAALQVVALNADGSAATGGYGAKIGSDNYRGMYVQAGPGWYAAVFNSNAGILLTGGGPCIGCTMAYFAQNNGSEAIQPGDFVAAEGVVLDPDLNTPILQVHKANSAKDAIIGVAIGALERTPVGEFNGWQTGGYQERASDPVASGQHLSVAVQGLVQANLGQASALQVGDWIAVDSGQTIAAAGEAPRVGRLMSSVDETGMAWVMLSGQ